MPDSVEIWTGQHDRFLNLHKSPSTVIYINFPYFYCLFSRFPLLKHPAWHLGILSSLKHAIGKGNVWNTVHESEYGIWQLGQETCQIHHATEIKIQSEFALFISRADYWKEEWNQYSMNEFISLLMKWTHEGHSILEVKNYKFLNPITIE